MHTCVADSLAIIAQIELSLNMASSLYSECNLCTLFCGMCDDPFLFLTGDLSTIGHFPPEWRLVCPAFLGWLCSPCCGFFGFLLVDGLFLPRGAFPIVLFDHPRLTISASGSRYGRGLMQRPNSAALQKSVKKVPANCCTSPGIKPPKAPKCSFVTRRAVLQNAARACRGRCR